jgi:hypothetical protein
MSPASIVRECDLTEPSVTDADLEACGSADPYTFIGCQTRDPQLCRN